LARFGDLESLCCDYDNSRFVLTLAGEHSLAYFQGTP